MTENNTASEKHLSFGADIMRRIKAVTPRRWVRFGLVSLAFFLWVIWLGNPWVLFAWLLLVDIYITGYIPWGGWKKLKAGAVRTVAGWVDAIVYALVLVYFIFAFIGQNYNIPTSSLEKSLLVGDYLWVNKTIYGPRVPMTPVHFPLAHNTMPLLGTKSYLDHPSFAYHRLPGLRSVERGDIVVFNFPQGDTVVANAPGGLDYYQICHTLRQNGIADPRQYILDNEAQYGKLIVRPVDRRENYVKRAIGLPGETLAIRHDTVFINGKPIKEPDNVQYNYIVPVNQSIPEMLWQEIGARLEDRGEGPMEDPRVDKLFYSVPLTYEAKAAVEKWPQVAGKLQRESDSGIWRTDGVFPLGNGYGWTRPDMGPFWIPKRGMTLHLTAENLPLYRRAITTYEGNDLQLRDGKIYINGKQTDYYTFKMDYYWMMGDNRDRSLDSRFWGFVPEDHIVGSPARVLISIDDERGLLGGGMRWNRILHDANPDKKKSAEKGWN